LSVGWRESGVGGDDGEHGCHVGADHAGSLAEAGDADGFAADLNLAAGNLVRFVGRRNPFSRCEKRVLTVSEIRRSRLCPRGDFVHRQEDADDAGGHDQGLLLVGSHSRRGELS